MKNLIASIGLICFSFQLFGASFTVTNTNDDGPGSLRDHIALAELHAGVDTIRFDSLINGDTIFLTTGDIFVGNPLVIIGNGPGNTIISGDGSRIFFLGIGALETEIRNMQIINGLEDSANGGGVSISGPSPSFYNVHFKNNRVTGATRVGGAVNISAFNGDTISITFEDCVFEDNSAFLRGGGVYISGNDVGVKVIFRRCRFEENECLDGNGGAVYFFSNNNLNTHGSFYECEFTDNYAETNGGGIFGDGFNGEVSCYMEACHFAGNEAENSAGGAISFSIAGSGASNSQIINSIFIGNQAGFRGGAVNFSDLAGNSDFSIVNCSFSGNNADSEGGALYLNGITGNIFLPEIYNTAISGNSSGLQGLFFNPDTRHCLIQDSLYSGPGNIDGSAMINVPEFVEPGEFTTAPDTTGDLRLKPCSPLINAGDASLVPHSIMTDAFGQPRVVYEQIDIGAYEYPDPAPTDPLIADGCNNCPFYFNIIQTAVSDTTGAFFEIRTIGAVTTSGDAVLQAPSTLLGPGFSTLLGDVFEVIVEPCDED